MRLNCLCVCATRTKDMADRKVLAHDRDVEMARTFYESALADYDHAVVLDPQVRCRA